MALRAAARPVAVVNPRHIRTLAQAVGRLAKPDRMAARGSAHCAGAVTLAPRPLPEAKPQELRALLGGGCPLHPGQWTAGKAKKVALIACLQKLVTLMNARVRARKPWQPQEVPSAYHARAP